VIELLRRLEKTQFEGRTLTLKVKFADFQQITRSITVGRILRTKDDILPLAKQLLREVAYSREHPIRLLGLGIGKSSVSHDGEEAEEPRWVQLELEFKELSDTAAEAAAGEATATAPGGVTATP
jgi:DNA polymerase-4